ncbi:uncharacterized mitochondrial protein AtMg00860-like [Helianthus annuus]|uniref:uncharacterized mitochondrial protein AtMg00860-like n=1 Tax=Helianthus annuus TaxID=4232 RepID=UPI000B902084|nr:uncharacterized mitochondrial protein AtMg00860-like [Helianthus annuus]
MVLQKAEKSVEQQQQLQQLLESFDDVFQDLKSLPPSRGQFDHRIPLKQGTNDINLRPYSPCWQSHLSHLEDVLGVLRQHRLVAKKSKCEFGTTELEYLGHIISQEGVAMDPAKVSTIQQWPIPKNIKELRGFLGLTGYYRRFVKDYGSITKPLTQLLKKDSFCWSGTAQQAFE